MLAGKRALVIGLGVTGRALMQFLLAHGARVAVAEKRAEAAAELTVDLAAELAVASTADPAAGITMHLGPEDRAWLSGVDLVIPSPGVPRDNLLLREAQARGVPVLSEIELAARFLGPVTAAVTGTNGKSTVTSLLGEIFQAAGRRVFVGGNLGTPLIAAVDGPHEASVVEVSSYQLEWTQSFRPRVGVYLNLSEDHLDRYRDLEEYGAFKARLFAFQTATDWALLNRDDPGVWKIAANVPGRVASFGLKRPAHTPAIWPEGRNLRYELDGRSGAIEFDSARMPGRHGLVNAMAAVAAAILADLPPDAVGGALNSFHGLPHRIERVAEKGGVTFVDDSKGTNVGAVVEALAAVAPPLILLAGGVDKGGDYGPLRAPLAERAKALVLFGQARERIRDALAGTTRIEMRETLAQAVACAWSLAARGDTVLLSPACASFDQFRNYAERGNKFQALVAAL